MDNQRVPEVRTAASAELSRDISRVVSRVLTGEKVDAAKTGAELAAKYPDLGMSGPMIKDAITRAAGMMGMIRGEAEPAAPAAATLAPPASRAFTAPLPGSPPTTIATTKQPATKPAPTLPKAEAIPPVPNVDAPFEALDLELEALIFGPKKPTVVKMNGNAAPRQTKKVRSTTPAKRDEPIPEPGFGKGAIAAFRRAIFKS